MCKEIGTMSKLSLIYAFMIANQDMGKGEKVWVGSEKSSSLLQLYYMSTVL